MAFSLSMSRVAAPKAGFVSNGTNRKVTMKAQAYHVEVVPGDNENEDSALRRFRRQCNVARIVPEVRRRQEFENPQDIKKRKQKEKGQLKRLPAPQSWEEAFGQTDAPFADMFGDAEDIFADSA